MDYIVFYRTLENNHAKWGPQWTHHYEAISTDKPLVFNDDVTAVLETLRKEHLYRKLEIVSILSTVPEAS